MAAARSQVKQVQAAQMQREEALERLRGRKPPEKKIRLILDDAAAERYEAARSASFVAQAGSDDVAKRKAAKEEAEAEQGLIDGSLEFHLRSAGREAYEALLREHPPTDKSAEEREAVRLAQEELGVTDTAKLPFSLITFPPALVALSLVSPQLTAEDITELSKNTLSTGELGMLFQTSLLLHTQVRVAELEK